MPARSRLLAIAVCIAAALVGSPTAAQASDTKQITRKVDSCTAGIASSINLWVTDLSEQEATSIGVGVQTASGWMDAALDYYNSSEQAAAYTATNLDAQPKDARITVPRAWNGSVGVGVHCTASKKPKVTPACDLDGIDPKVLNVKVYNPNAAKISYTVAVTQTSGSPVSSFSNKRLTALPYATEEADFKSINDWSSYRTTVTGSDGSKVTKTISCGVMPGSANKPGSERRPGDIKVTPAARESASSTAAPSPTTAPELLIPEAPPQAQQPQAREKKPASGVVEPPQLIAALAIFIGVFGGIAGWFFLAYRKNRREETEGTGDTTTDLSTTTNQ